MIEEYLQRLFTRESLENTERGVEFELKNRLVEAEIEGVHLAKLDGDRVPLEDVTVVLEDGSRVGAGDITGEDPIEFPLATTLQVVLDRQRLRIGTHRLDLGVTVEGVDRVSFGTTAKVTEADLLDVDPGAYEADELVALAGEIREPVSLERLRDREAGGRARDRVLAELDDLLAAAEPLAAEPTDGPAAGEKTTGDTLVDGLLVDVLESPQRVSVYFAARTLRGGTAEEIAAATLLPSDLVETTLEDFEREGIAEYEDGTYEVAPPVTVLSKRSTELWTVLRTGLSQL